MRAETRGEPRTTVPTATGGSGSGGGETPTVAKEEVAEEGVAVSSGGLRTSDIRESGRGGAASGGATLIATLVAMLVATLGFRLRFAAGSIDLVRSSSEWPSVARRSRPSGVSRSSSDCDLPAEASLSDSACNFASTMAGHNVSLPLSCVPKYAPI